MSTKTVDFSRYSSIRVGQEVDVYLIDEVGSYGEFFIVGGACNLLVSPTPPPLAMLSKRFDYCTMRDGCLHIGGATKSGVIASFAKKHNLGGVEFLTKLPGTLGGLVAMNAGMKQDEIFAHLIGVQIDDRFVPKSEIDHGYRFARLDGTVFEAVFDLPSGWSEEKVALFGAMRHNQPKEPSAGSAFKNPVGDYAGRLIEAVGLKGYRKGAMAWSEVHANFLINHGGGVYDDALWLIKEAKSRVSKEFGIALECEVKII